MEFKIAIFTNRNNLLNEIFYKYIFLPLARYQTLWQDLFFTHSCITKQRQSFMCQSVNQSVPSVTLKQRGLQLRN